MEPTATAHEAVRLMADKNIGALVVVEHDKVVGIVSERDYARKLMSRSSKDTPLRDIMSSPVMYVHPETSDECMALMTENRLRHLPVMGQRPDDRSPFHRRPGQGHHLRAAVHHRATRTLHLGAARLTPGSVGTAVGAMNDTDAIEAAMRYHERTKHRFNRYAPGPGELDWANQPSPFRRYGARR